MSKFVIETYVLPEEQKLKEFSPPKLKPKARDNLKELLELFSEAKSPYEPLFLSGTYRGFLRHSKFQRRLYLAVKRDVVIGMVSYGQMGVGFNTQGHLYDLFVKPTQPSQIEGELLRFAMDRAKETIPYHPLLRRSVTTTAPVRNDALNTFLRSQGFQLDIGGVHNENLYRLYLDAA